MRKGFTGVITTFAECRRRVAGRGKGSKLDVYLASDWLSASLWSGSEPVLVQQPAEAVDSLDNVPTCELVRGQIGDRRFKVDTAVRALLVVVGDEPTTCSRSVPVSSTTTLRMTSTGGTRASPIRPTGNRCLGNLPRFVPLSFSDRKSSRCLEILWAEIRQPRAQGSPFRHVDVPPG